MQIWKKQCGFGTEGEQLNNLFQQTTRKYGVKNLFSDMFGS